MKSGLSLSDQHRHNELQKELTIQVKFIADLEEENRETLKKFYDGTYNKITNFQESKKAIQEMKDRRKEIKKSEKICEKIRKELKKFD